MFTAADSAGAREMSAVRVPPSRLWRDGARCYERPDADTCASQRAASRGRARRTGARHAPTEGAHDRSLVGDACTVVRLATVRNVNGWLRASRQRLVLVLEARWPRPRVCEGTVHSKVELGTRKLDRSARARERDDGERGWCPGCRLARWRYPLPYSGGPVGSRP